MNQEIKELQSKIVVRLKHFVDRFENEKDANHLEGELSALKIIVEFAIERMHAKVCKGE